MLDPRRLVGDHPDGAAIRLLRHARRQVRRVLGEIGRERFRGAFHSYAEALEAVPPTRLSGYDNDSLVDVAFDEMCRLHLWDYPVLFRLDRLVADSSALIDAGGHMGTKFRAFSRMLDLPPAFDWAVYDVPAIVREGQRRAAAEGLEGISFHDRMQTLPKAEILLASGLFQYLDMQVADFIGALPHGPSHVIINKVATCEGETVVTLEQFPGADVPYQIRNRAEFEGQLAALGYVIVDRWEISALNHRHPDFGQSRSFGYYAVAEESSVLVS